MSTISYLVNQAKRFTASGRARREHGAQAHAHPGSPSAWARYCIDQLHEGLRIVRQGATC